MSLFRFKQFSVEQDMCAMKVNTDGVLLGVWTDAGTAKTVLDIGTGTGVIAMMMVQKNNKAIVDAMDIDINCYLQAKGNFQGSIWNKRLNVFHSLLQEFYPERKYDVIVSNPPYFVDDFKTGNHQKNIAKHSIALSYKELFSGINRLLIENGKAFISAPSFRYFQIETIAQVEELFITKSTDVIAIEGKNPYLTLLQLERKESKREKSSITIQSKDGNFTEEYKAITREFYLKF